MKWKRLVCCCTLVGWVAALPAMAAAEVPETLSPAEAYFASDATLLELITLLLHENPEIRAARDQWRAMEQTIPQARALPDPRLLYRYYAQTPETRVGPQRHGLEFSQELPLSGKRGLQATRQEYLASGSAWDLREIEQDLVAELKRDYFETHYLREALAVNSEETALLQRFEQIALKRYATGEGIQQSVVKVQTDISRLTDRRIGLERQLEARRLSIGHLMGGMNFEWDLPGTQLELHDVARELAYLPRDHVDAHAAVRSLIQRVEADKSWARRRSLDSRPDLRLGLQFVEVGTRDDPAGVASPPADNGQDILALTVGLNIPLHRKRIRAGVAEASLRSSATKNHLEHVRHRLAFHVQESVLNVEALEERTRLYEEVLLPQAQEALASSEAAYTTGRLDFLDLLDSQRVLFQLRLAHQRLLADFWIALSELEHALGRRFPTSPTEDRS